MEQAARTPDIRYDVEELPSATVTVLADNVCGDGDVLGEWGLSLLLTAGDTRILLDSGAGHVLRGNARALHVDLSAIDALVLSHGHNDHTGGIEALLAEAKGLRVFAHPGVFETKYWMRDGVADARHIQPSRGELAARVTEIVDTRAPTFITPAVLVTGEIPRETAFEDTGLTTEVFLDHDLTRPDPILDDQALVFRVPEGVVVLMGCGHAGVVNTLRHVCRLAGVARIHAVMGGTHLFEASPARMAETMAALDSFGVERLFLSHCTGLGAYARLAEVLPGRCTWPRSGTVVRFGAGPGQRSQA
jgi:7,8-dihydropterin-6-yl-methyl-4-(beta-D-ribofuranosyl)aminobenzene 5'-phosphate synthase